MAFFPSGLSSCPRPTGATGPQGHGGHATTLSMAHVITKLDDRANCLLAGAARRR